jgi:alpha-tubulin suppressor-like RCC1 family protein
MTLALTGLAVVSLLASGCNSAGPAGVEQVTSALVSSASLQLKVLTNSCGANQMQDFFQVINTGTTAVKLSDIKIKYWADDTSGQAVAPHIATGGCASGANGSPSCLHQVSGTTVAAAQFSPACGPDASHQANWEITISDTDSNTLAAGATWNNIQTSINLTSFTNFNPGPSKWFSPCLTGSAYVADSHFALYYQGNPVFASGLPVPSCRGPQGQQTVTGHLTPEILATPIIGPVPQTTVMHMAVAMPLRNTSDLDAQIGQVSDPSSPNYRHYLTVDQFTAAYGPTTTDHQAVVSWAQSKGLTVEKTYSNRLQVNVTGTAAALEMAFQVNMFYRRRPDGTQFWAPDREPALDLTTPVSHIVQLTNYFVPKRASGSSADGSLLGSDFRRAYVPCLSSTVNGFGQTVGLYGGDGFSMGSISSFASVAGFNAPPVRAIHSDSNVVACKPFDHPCRDGSVCKGTCPTNYPCPATNLCGSGVACATGTQCTDDNTVCGVSGCPADSACATTGSACPSVISGLDAGGPLEIHLDIEMAMSMAPGVNEIRVFQGAYAFQDMVTTTPLSFQISSSWYLGPATPDMRNIFKQLALQGQSFSLASGDFGAINDPASSADLDGITLIGGTNLDMNGNGNSYNSETGWAGSSGWIADGGGVAGASSTPIPSYQSGIDMTAAGGSNSFRNAPDVSLPANFVWMVYPGGSGPIGGTSCASPLWAGFMALVNQQSQTNGLGPVGFANPAIYGAASVPATYASSFNDIMLGQSGGIHGGFGAVAGYDLVTGLGTPKCALVAQLSSSSPAPNRGVSVGVENTCAIRPNRSVSCWGQNDVGQIGNVAATNPQLTPLGVSGLPRRATALAAGRYHNCALLSDKTVWCWGSNAEGAIGVPGAASPAPATQVTSLTGVTALTSGQGHTCALMGDQTVKCWGRNDEGQIGNNSTTDSPSPTTVPGLTGVTSIAAGPVFTCAVTGSDSHLECWGERLGFIFAAQPPGSNLTPVPVTLASGALLTGVASVAGGSLHMCALMQDTSLLCWGNNYDGEDGNGSSDVIEPFPVPVNTSCVSSTPMTGVKQVVAASNHSCALKNDGTVWCWGINLEGELGDTTTSGRSCAQPVFGLTGQSAISGGGEMTCAINSFGVSCWGGGVVGDGSTSTAHATATTVRFF